MRPTTLLPSLIATCVFSTALAQSPKPVSRYPVQPRPLPEAEEIALGMSAAPS